jgi:hypothetical protein
VCVQLLNRVTNFQEISNGGPQFFGLIVKNNMAGARTRETKATLAPLMSVATSAVTVQRQICTLVKIFVALLLMAMPNKPVQLHVGSSVPSGSIAGNSSRRLPDKLRPHLPSVPWVPGLRQPGRGGDHSPLSSAEVKIEWICTSVPPTATRYRFTVHGYD